MPAVRPDLEGIEKVSNKTKKCRYCQTFIKEDAKVCFQCKKSQSFFLAKLETTAAFVPVISMVLSISLVSLSWLQFLEATKQRNSVDRAAQSATDALRQAAVAKAEVLRATTESNKAKLAAERARDEARNSLENLRSNIKLLLEMDELTPKIVEESYDSVKAGKVRRKLEEFAVPDEKEREKWLKSLK